MMQILRFFTKMIKRFCGSAIILFATSATMFACVGFSDDTASSETNNIRQLGWSKGRNGSVGRMGWTNINNEFDMALQMIWPIMVRKGYTNIELPDMTEGLSLKPLFITYMARLWLTNGLLYNIEGISRNGDAMMTYHNKSFQFRVNLVVSNVEFIYDYTVGLIAIEIPGKVGGAVQNTVLIGDFSISAEDKNIRLNNFRIDSFENIEIRLKYNSIIKQLSGSILRPLTDLFKDRIIAIVGDAVRIKLEKLIDDVNENDRLQFKEFGRITLAGLLG